MGKAAQSTEFSRTLTGSRKVWVLNSHTEDYVEEFRGDKVRVPANNEKALIMPYLEARRFLGQPKAPAEVGVDGKFITGPKALRTVELTDEEFSDFEGKSSKELEKIAKEDNRKASAELTRSLKKTNNARPVDEE